MIDHRSPRNVLITGASAGIGRVIALDLAARGHRVFATGRNVEALAALKADATKQGGRVETVVLDVTSHVSVVAAHAAVRAATEGHGVDVLINNAGYGQGGPLMELPEAALRRQFDTNVFGLMDVTQVFAQEMVTRGVGWVVNVSSLGGRITFPLFGAYHASKYALEALSDALRVELRAMGVHVALIEPGPIRSQFSERVMTDLPRPQSGTRYAAAFAYADSLRSQVDGVEFGPEHVSRAVVHAISARWPRARYACPWFLGIPMALFPFVPTWLSDWLMAWSFRLDAATTTPTANP